MTTLNKGWDVLVGGDLNDENPLKGMSSVPVIANIGEYDYLERKVRPGGGGTSTMITP